MSAENAQQKIILVTGGGGQLGREIDALDPIGNTRCYCMDKNTLDITRPDSIKDVIEDIAPDVIINAAAFTHVDAAEDAGDQVFAINEAGAGNVARIAAGSAVPVIQISTDYVFDGSQKTPIDERAAPNPLNRYGASKLAGERQVADSNPQHIIVRTSWLFGRFGNNFMKTIMRLAAREPSVSIVDDQLGSPTCTAHLARVVLKIADRLSAGRFTRWGIYHYCDQPSASWFELAVEVIGRAQALGLLGSAVSVQGIATDEYPTAAERPAQSVLDCEKIRSVFGIEQFDWRSCLDTALQGAE